MVVARPALHQTSAGKVSINTKVCCTLLGVEYAGYGMDHPASDRSDRRLRPRALCLRCKRLESLCACKKQRQPASQRTAAATSTRSRTSQVTGQPQEEEGTGVEPPKGLATRSRPRTTTANLGDPGPSSATTSSLPAVELMLTGSPPKYDPDAPSTSVEVLSVKPQPSVDEAPSGSMQLRAHSSTARETTSLYSHLLHEALGKSSSESSDMNTSDSSTTTSSSSSSSSASTSYESSEKQEVEAAVDDPSTPQPSTSQHVPICDTPKSSNIEMIPRRLFSSPGKKSTRSVQTSQTKGKSHVHPTASGGAVKSTTNSPPDVFKFSTASELREGTSAPPRTVAKSTKVRKVAPKRLRMQKAPSRGSPKASGGGEPLSVPSTSRGSSQKGHVCPECGKAFGSPGKLSQHMFSHTGERPFPCSQCSKAFSSKFKLVRHNLIHSTVRRFVCGTCGRQFHRKDHLQNHAKIHAAVKLKFQCDRADCNKEYTSANSARKHSAAHAAQDGQLDCTLCGRHFATTPEVLHHLKVHAGSRAVKTQADRKFTCEVCGRSFFTRKDVRRHFVVHTGLRDFLCQFCPQRFGRKDHLVRHIKKSHQSGWTKIRRKTRRVVMSTSPTVTVDTGSSPGPSSVQDPSLVVVKHEPEEMHGVVEVKEEVLQPPELQPIAMELPPEIPLYPPPPYPKQEEIDSPYLKQEEIVSPYLKPPPPEDLSQFYSIVPDIQRLFTTESGNGHLLMSIMESVELNAPSRASEMLPSTSQVLSPALISESLTLAEQMMGSTTLETENLGLCEPSLTEQLLDPAAPSTSQAVMETLLREEGDKNSAPLPRFDQAFPPQ